MKKLFISTLSGWLLCPLLPVRASAANILTEVDVQYVDTATRVIMYFSEQAVFDEPVVLENPHRLLLYFKGSEVYASLEDRLVGQGMVTAVRYQYKESKLKEKEVEYVVFHLDQKPMFDLEHTKKVVTIDIGTLKSDAAENKVMRLKPSKTVVLKDLESCLQFALASDPRIAVASDEIRLAKFRKWEAMRTLWPGVTAKYEKTLGEALRDEAPPDFDELTYGIQMRQPLYQGGKLWATFRQSQLNYDMAKLRYEELVGDIVFDVSRAYYSYVKTRKTQEAYQELGAEIRADVASSRKRFAMKLSTNIEYLRVENQKKQVDYDIASAEKDDMLARLALLQALYAPKDMDLPLELAQPFGTVEIALDETLRYAVLNRQNLKIARMELEVHEWGKKIGSSANALHIDFSGFAGKSGGAYKTEDLNLGEDYSLGMELSKPFGGNTIKSSLLYDRTSPKVGQSSRTQSKTGLVTLSLLDNIKGYSDSLEGSIKYDQARIKLIEEQARIERDVQESYFNIQKSFLQVEAGYSEVDLARREVTAARSKKEQNMAQISELIAARIAYTQAHKTLVEALSFFNISLAHLNKAVGQTDKFTVRGGK